MFINTYRALLALLILCSPFIAFSQKSLKKGFIVTNANDTLRGTIDYRNWDNNPTSILFYKNAEGTAIKCLPENTLSVSINLATGSEIYRSYKVDYNSTSEQLDRSSSNSQPELKSSQLFLLLLNEGALNLYKFKDKYDREHFFIAKAREHPVELINHTYITSDYIRHINPVYKTQLEQLLLECGNIKKEELKNLDYSAKRIAAMINKFNNCNSNESYSFKAEKNPPLLRLIAGGSYTSYKMKGIPYFDHPFSSSLAPTFGLSVNFVFPRNEKRTSLNTELLVKTQKNEGSKKEGNSENYRDYFHSVNATYLKFNVMFRHRFGRSSLKPFYTVGISNAFALSLKTNQSIHKVFYTNHEYENSEIEVLTRKFEQGILGGLGLSLGKRSDLEFRMEVSNGASTAAGVGSFSTSGFLLYTFQLKTQRP